MGDGGDRLHFDGVHLFQRVVQYTWGINCLESQILVIEMSNEQTLGCESIRLNINVCSSDAFQETGLANVWVTTDEKRPGVRIDRRKTTKMLSDLIEVEKRVFQPFADGGHAT